MTKTKKRKVDALSRKANVEKQSTDLSALPGSLDGEQSDPDIAGRPAKRSRINQPDPSPADQDGDRADQRRRHDPSSGSQHRHELILPSQLKFLFKKHDFILVSVISSSKMRSKIKSILDHLTAPTREVPEQRNKVIALRSAASCASKMVGIVEIVKQELATDKLNLYQYTRLESIIQPFKEKKKPIAADTPAPAPTGVQVETSERQEDSDDSYEELARPQQQHPSPPIEREKVRNHPVLTIFLSKTSIPDLKGLYG